MYFLVLSMAAFIVGLLSCIFILLCRNDELANEIVQLIFEKERIK
jgi:hypothetical protein